MNAARADQLRGELQWQVQMKRQLEEETKKKEALEDKLYEESVRRQQERMNQEYEAELHRKRKKEEEVRCWAGPFSTLVGSVAALGIYVAAL